MTEEEMLMFLWVPAEPWEGEEELGKLDSWAADEPAPVYIL